MQQIERIDLRITVLQGADLVAKDKTFLGRKGSSDPYVEVWTTETTVGTTTSGGQPHHQRGKNNKIGTTPVESKTLEPKWTRKNCFATSIHKPTVRPAVTLKIYDSDSLSLPDLMGVVTILVPTADGDSNSTAWYDIPPGSAKNASGRLQVRVEAKILKSRALVAGNAMQLVDPAASSRTLSMVKVGLSWDVLGGNRNVDLDASLVAITQTGALSLPDTVYYGNRCNSNESVVHSGDEREGDEVGDDESMMVFLDQIPSNVLAVYVIVTVATEGVTLGQVRSAIVRVYDVTSSMSQPAILASFTPSQNALSDNATAVFLVRLARSATAAGGWTLSPIEETHPTARDFGALIPHAKALTRDLLPHIRIDPTERVGILRKGGNVRLADYSGGNKLPSTVVLGLAWDVTNGVNIDLDASIICLDSDLNLVDTIFFGKLRSDDGSVRHHGDEREGDERGDDEKITIVPAQVSPNIQYMGIVINSFSGQELDDVNRASCHLFDPVTKLDICSYALTNAVSLNGYTALVLGCLYRGPEKGDWGFCIISEAASGRTSHENVDELQNYLRHHKPTIPPPMENQGEGEIIENFSMPTYKPMAEEHEIDLSAPSIGINV